MGILPCPATESPSEFVETVVLLSPPDTRLVLQSETFRVSVGRNSANIEDLTLTEVFGVLPQLGLGTINLASSNRVHMDLFDSDGRLITSTVLRNLLVAEAPEETFGTCFVFVDRHWFEIGTDFLNTINQAFEKTLADCLQLTTSMPSWSLDHSGKPVSEGEYTAAVSKEDDHMVLMHNKHVVLSSGSDRVEVCDLYDCEHNLLIFVKRGLGERFRELVTQVENSVAALMRNSEFRKKAADAIVHNSGKQISPPDLRRSSVVLAFADHGKRQGMELHRRLTTISKMDLVSCYQQLQSMGLNDVRLVEIQTARSRSTGQIEGSICSITNVG